jgi:hypothetical protein
MPAMARLIGARNSKTRRIVAIRLASTLRRQRPVRLVDNHWRKSGGSDALVGSLASAHARPDVSARHAWKSLSFCEDCFNELVQHVVGRLADELRVREERLVVLAKETRDVPNDVLLHCARFDGWHVAPPMCGFE